MKTTYRVLSLLAITALALAACTPPSTTEPTTVVEPTDMATDTPTEVATATEAPTATEAATATAEIPVTGGGVLNVMDDPSVGQFLVDSSGMTVYANKNDTADNSTCSDDCITEWPPVISTGDDASSVGDGVDATKLGTLTRTDGTTQVTYNGWPLYTFADDTQSGDMMGQDDEDEWFMVSALGEPIETTMSTPDALATATP